MDPKTVQALAEIVKEYDLTVLEVDGQGIRMERAAPMMAPMPNTVTSYAAVTATETLTAKSAEEEITLGTPVRAPLVGVFYAAAAPDKPPFVQAGDRVKKGDTLCIIEAMKLMNEIPADHDGEIREICAQNGQVVEYGQILFRLG